MRPVRVPRVLPIVLSRDEVRRLIEAARNVKHQTALSVAYGAGVDVPKSTWVQSGGGSITPIMKWLECADP